ncbi:MAG TPA: response regulator transcription factor [Candidatus Eisenbacteria bacterium]|nr:response regulator transcription factor [Candidatus Eisenbacteria bacterium]
MKSSRIRAILVGGMANPKFRILVVEDDPKTAGLVRLYLEHAGYSVSMAGDGVEALRLARLDPAPDLVVLDVMLPKLDGLRVCRELRLGSDAAVILLTARSTEEDRLEGLDLGADDYVTKPFSPRELVARVRAVLRRRPAGRNSTRTGDSFVGRSDRSGPGDREGSDRLVSGDVEIDLARRVVRARGRAVELTPREFDLLAALLRQPGRVFTRDDLAVAAFGPDYEASGRTIDVHVKNLRAKIERDPASPSRIVTVFGVGYRLAEPGGDGTKTGGGPTPRS